MMSKSPYYRFFRRYHFPLPFGEWRKLPRHLTHKNEYWDGEVRLTPRPKTCDVFLSLSDWSAPINPDSEDRPGRVEVSIRRLADEDWPALSEVFHSAFAQVQPLYSWNSPAAATASRAILRWSKLGQDGPLVQKACFVAHARHMRSVASDPLALCGCAIVTLVNEITLRSAPDGHAVPHPEESGKNVFPHLNWIFVSRRYKRSGVGTLLLEDVVSALRNEGFLTLASTFLADNTESMMWHWRNGFALRCEPWGASKPVRLPHK
jgi:GNAT superfamily N-acetyltransferase